MAIEPPIGVRNGNPFNLKSNPDDPWLGSIGIDPAGHAIFGESEEAITYAVRAGSIILFRYWQRGVKSLEAITAEWAPKSDGNKPDEYADFLVGHVGYRKNRPLEMFWADGTIRWPKTLFDLLVAISIMEVSHDFGLDTVPGYERKIYDGFKLYHETFVIPNRRKAYENRYSKNA